MSRFPYRFFNEYVVRTPLFSYKNFWETLHKDEISDTQLKEICNSPVFQEAIYLASPYLLDEIKKWLSGKELSLKQLQKLKNTILKYYSRMSTRCTPFGLFSAVGIGKFSDHDNDSYSGKVRDTKLDMHFLVGLADYFVKTKEIRNQLLFFPNNSIYIIGNKIRYIEYEYANGKRDYIISSAQLSEELQQILNFTKQGKTIREITDILINNDITEADARDFIEELIDNQILVSELEPNVSGNDFLDILIYVLDRINAKTEVENLILIRKKLNELDKNIGNPIFLYSEIEELIKTFKSEYEKKYLFQTDLYNEEDFLLPSSWKKELKNGIGFLNKLSLLQKDTYFEKFKNAFRERFETEEVSLAYVLDTEIGIGYRQNLSTKGTHTYLGDLDLLVSKRNQNLTIELNPIHKILNEKVQYALLENQSVIELLIEDFKDFEESWDNVPSTISFMAEIISDKNFEKLYLKGSSRNTGANLLGRFCSEKSKINQLTKNITDKEKELNPGFIVAEVIHLPEARIGNVIRRSTLREYEIPYLSQSVLPKEYQILVEDLFISLRNDKIILRSKKLDMEIKPNLTNAHNYYTNTLPVYHFLSDLHSQDIKSEIFFSWGGLENIYNFLPRVEYKNIILSKAQWKIVEKDITALESSISDKEYFLSELKNWRFKRKIPVWIQLVKFDNTLTLNLRNYDMANLFIQTIKKEKSVIIEEFLYNENDDFKREFIFPMHRVKNL